MVKSPIPPVTPGDRHRFVRSNPTVDLAERGWRYADIMQPDGTIASTQVPLTPDEFLHPQEGYHLPNSTFHDQVAGDARDMLARRYVSDPTVGVFRDLLIEWDNPDLRDHCPDTFVAFGIQNKELNRSKFIVSHEETRPALVIEVISPRYRKEDREIKVIEYAQAQVQEYIIVDRHTQRGQILDEVLGYRLVGRSYQPISPDEDGRILCETVGLWISLQTGQLVMEEVQTGQRLLTSIELEATNRELETTNRELEAAKELAQQRAADTEALLARYQERFGDLSP